MLLRFKVLGAGLALALTVGNAKASYIINVRQIGSSVVFSGSGRLDLTGLTKVGNANYYASQGINPSFPYVGMGHVGGMDAYSGLMDVSFGPDEPADFDTSTGPGFAIVGHGRVLVPAGYVSGDSLGESTGTFLLSDFSRLGLTKGIFEQSWSFDKVVINVGMGSVSTVPLPATAPLLAVALLGLGGFGYAARRKTVTVTA